MGNAPSAGLEGTESQRRVVEVMETKDDRSSGFNELANPNSESGDDGSSNLKPLQLYLDDEFSSVSGSDCFDSEYVQPSKQLTAFVHPQFVPVRQISSN